MRDLAVEHPVGLDALPRPSLPATMLTAEYWLRPARFFERCAQLGERFLLRMPGQPSLVCLTNPADVRAVFTGDQTSLHFGEVLMKMAPHELILGSNSITVKDDEPHLRDRRMFGPHFGGKALAREPLHKWVPKREVRAAASARSGARPRIFMIRRGFRDAVDRGWIALRSRKPLVQRFPRYEPDMVAATRDARDAMRAAHDLRGTALPANRRTRRTTWPAQRHDHPG
jgi:hypothetical protein